MKSSKPQPKPVKLEYFVGYEKEEEGYRLYTIYPEAISFLADHGIEFEHDPVEKVMRSQLLAKLPKKLTLRKSSLETRMTLGDQDSGFVVFYDIKDTNKKIPDHIRESVARHCEELDSIDEQINELKKNYERELDRLNMMEARTKTAIRMNLEDHGVIVKRGRYFHRAMLIDDFRVFLKTDFTFDIKSLDPEELSAIAAEVAEPHRTALESCIKITGVEIDAKFYNEQIKKTLKPQDRKAFVKELQEVDEERLKNEILPKIPYKHRLLFWWMNTQVDEENGQHYYTLHSKTYNSKNPECQECGGKFIKKTNVCRDCGLTSFTEVTKSEKAPEPAVKNPLRKRKFVLRPVKTLGEKQVKNGHDKKASKRGVPAQGESRD